MSVKFQTRHYKEIAFLLSCAKPTHSGDRYDDGRMSEWSHIVDKFCEEFAKDNPKFNVKKLVESCHAYES